MICLEVIYIFQICFKNMFNASKDTNFFLGSCFALFT